MAAYSEGLGLLERANVGAQERSADAETAPLGDPLSFPVRHRHRRSDREVWRRGSVIGSWLLDLTAAALHADPALEAFEGRVSDSGEGRWTVLAAVEAGAPVPTIADALFSRFASRVMPTLATRSRRQCGPSSVVTTKRRLTDGNDGRCAFVLFGITGDLAKKKLFSALYTLDRPAS
ncbi:MAG: hypothetical protein R2706_03760 [Acidimicrobiales bacterium]